RVGAGRHDRLDAVDDLRRRSAPQRSWQRDHGPPSGAPPWAALPPRRLRVAMEPPVGSRAANDRASTVKHRSIPGAALVGLLAAAAIAMACATGVGLLLRLRSSWRDHRPPAAARPFFDARIRAYEPFTIAHLHP